MKISELKPAAGSKHASKRVGRGIGSGMGKTSARGHKGQKARSGGGVRPGFEGGQMPLHRRLPKRGFKNVFAKEVAEVALSALNVFEDGAVVNAEAIYEKGIVRPAEGGVKVLSNGDLTKKLTVQVPCSAGAAAKIEALGGKVEVI